MFLVFSFHRTTLLYSYFISRLFFSEKCGYEKTVVHVASFIAHNKIFWKVKIERENVVNSLSSTYLSSKRSWRMFLNYIFMRKSSMMIITKQNHL